MGLRVRGISYLTGETRPDVVRRDLRAIREELHCTAVMLIGTDLARQVEAARHALDAGLDVYLRPYLGDLSRREALAHLAEAASAAEQLRAAYPDRVTLLAGSELSHTTRGIVPGPKVFIRLWVVLRFRRLLHGRVTRRLNALLADALAAVRREFHGPVTYAAAHWEEVDWSGFDLVGVNLYRFGTDPAGYERRLHALARDAGKPVVITEFGCGAHRGADRRGPGSFRIVNWFATPPRVKDGNLRDEATQAAYLSELIELYDAHRVHGCFVFTFAMPDYPHHPDPRQDLDMAGFGVVKVAPDDTSSWQPKHAYREVARRYQALSGH